MIDGECIYAMLSRSDDECLYYILKGPSFFIQSFQLFVKVQVRFAILFLTQIRSVKYRSFACAIRL